MVKTTIKDKTLKQVPSELYRTSRVLQTGKSLSRLLILIYRCMVPPP